MKLIHEIVSYMKIIKMYGWELMFKDLVEKVSTFLFVIVLIVIVIVIVIERD